MEENKVLVTDLETLESYEASMADAEDETTNGGAIVKVVSGIALGVGAVAGAVYGIKKIPAVQDAMVRHQAKKELNKQMKADQKASRLAAKQQKQLEVIEVVDLDDEVESTSEE